MVTSGYFFSSTKAGVPAKKICLETSPWHAKYTRLTDACYFCQGRKNLKATAFLNFSKPKRFGMGLRTFEEQQNGKMPEVDQAFGWHLLILIGIFITLQRIKKQKKTAKIKVNFAKIVFYFLKTSRLAFGTFWKARRHPMEGFDVCPKKFLPTVPNRFNDFWRWFWLNLQVFCNFCGKESIFQHIFAIWILCTGATETTFPWASR